MSSVFPLPAGASLPDLAAVAPARAASSMVSVEASSATARLALSRDRLRRAMLDHTKPKRASSQDSDPSWLDRLKSFPGAAVVIDALSGWWARHPLNALSAVAVDAARAAVQPVAQRNPLALMLVALVLGGALAWTRPWRWILKPALFAGLLPQVASKIVSQVPIETWLGFASNLGAGKPAAPTPP